MFTIYGLIDPRTLMIRYVGLTANHPSVRLESHMNTNSGKSERKNQWINELKVSRLKPLIVALDFAPDIETAGKQERWWIAHGLLIGWELTNNTYATQPYREPKQRHSGDSAQVPPKEKIPAEPVVTDAQQRIIRHFEQNPTDGVRSAARALGISKSHVWEVRQMILHNKDVRNEIDVDAEVE